MNTKEKIVIFVTVTIAILVTVLQQNNIDGLKKSIVQINDEMRSRDARLFNAGSFPKYEKDKTEIQILQKRVKSEPPIPNPIGNVDKIMWIESLKPDGRFRFSTYPRPCSYKSFYIIIYLTVNDGDDYYTAIYRKDKSQNWSTDIWSHRFVTKKSAMTAVKRAIDEKEGK